MGTLRDDLMDASAYPARDASSIARAETHASWVFLLPREVFKVKRPVDFGFLDFRTLDQRRRACEAEVTLNARLAPDVYLGVEEVRRRADGRHVVGGARESGDAIADYAVHMVRLREED